MTEQRDSGRHPGWSSEEAAGWASEAVALSDNEATQARYFECRKNGCSPALAEVLALRAFPSIRTDSTFNRGRCNGNQFEDCPALGDYYRRVAEAHGVSTTGKHYISGLAEFPGDPEAWVADRGDVARVAAQKGFNVSGDVTYRAPEREPMPDIEIADDLVESETREILADNPGARYEDVREQVYNLRSGRVDPNPLLVSDHNFDQPGA